MRRLAADGRIGGAAVRTRVVAALYDGRVDEQQIQEQQYDEQHYEDDGPDALSAAAGRVASIVGAAERASVELREQAELPASAGDGLSQEELVKRLVEEFDAQEVLDDPDPEEAT